MTFLSIIFIGAVATLAMTLVTELSFRIMNRPYHVVRILGNMLRFTMTTPLNAKPIPQLVLAGVLHLTIGILFAFLYQSLGMWLFSWSLAAQAITYGASISLLAIGGWQMFFDLHPGPPPLSRPVYLAIIGLGHMAFAFTLVAVMGSGMLSF